MCANGLCVCLQVEVQGGDPYTSNANRAHYRMQVNTINK